MKGDEKSDMLTHKMDNNVVEGYKVLFQSEILRHLRCGAVIFGATHIVWS